jgi:nicotinate phosphoribosyltransferase
MNLSLLTDLYQITMANAYFKTHLADRQAVFHLFFRKTPYRGGFTVAAGLEAAIEFIETFHYDASDLHYLASLRDLEGNLYFDEPFLAWLEKMKLEVDVDAVKEGTVVFPFEPLIRVKGPLIQAQLLESPLLNLINFPTLIATKAARLKIAAQNDTLLEFGMRRAQGIDGALTASRSAYIGGCDFTSNLLAGKKYGIPVRGTHAHSWVMVFEEEEEAFRAYAEAMPGNTIFLVDTYDTLEGVEKAIEVGKWLKSRGKTFFGIRLDSGDLAYLSIEARRRLDESGFPEAIISASNELDEEIIAELKRQGASITVWGVGTKLVTSANQSALDGVYKLSCVQDKNGQWRDTLKLSEQMLKISTPGILQVRRFIKDGSYLADMIYDSRSNLKGTPHLIDPFDPTREKKLSSEMPYIDLLEPIFRKGKRVYELPLLADIRSRTAQELTRFHSGVKRFLNPHQYVVGLETSLYEKKTALVRQIRTNR